MRRYFFLDHHGFGNVVLSTPILEKLNAWAVEDGNQASVLLLSHSHRELLRELPLDRLDFFYLTRLRKPSFYWLKLLKKIWKVDVMLAAPNVPEDTIRRVSSLIRPKRVIAEGFEDIKLDDRRHILDVQEKLMAVAGLKKPYLSPRLSVDRSSEKIASGILGLHPFVEVGKESKQWPIENFRKLLENHSFEEILLFGGLTDKEAMEKLKVQWPEFRISLPETFQMAETLSRLKRCDVFCSGDTGPAHMAAALQIPVFALFGPTDPQRIGPIYSKHRIVTPQNRLSSLLSRHLGELSLHIED